MSLENADEMGISTKLNKSLEKYRYRGIIYTYAPVLIYNPNHEQCLNVSVKYPKLKEKTSYSDVGRYGKARDHPDPLL